MSWRVAVRTRLGSLELQAELEGAKRPVALVGPNGAGKSTLLRIIAGAVTPLQGEIEVGGHTYFSTANGINLPIDQRRVGYVPQGYGLFPHLRVIDNVAFGLNHKTPRPSRGERQRAAEAALAEVGAAQLVKRSVRSLSGGERQRVALARALVVRPRMLLLDEPLSALDVSARRTLRGLLSEYLVRAGSPAIVVTHDVRDVLALDAEAWVLVDGRIVQRGPVDELRASPANAFVEEFVAADLQASGSFDGSAVGI